MIEPQAFMGHGSEFNGLVVVLVRPAAMVIRHKMA